MLLHAEEPSGDEGQEGGSADDAVHAAAAALFREWLAQHKAQAAKEDEVRAWRSLAAVALQSCDHRPCVNRQSAFAAVCKGLTRFCPHDATSRVSTVHFNTNHEV